MATASIADVAITGAAPPAGASLTVEEYQTNGVLNPAPSYAAPIAVVDLLQVDGGGARGTIATAILSGTGIGVEVALTDSAPTAAPPRPAAARWPWRGTPPPRLPRGTSPHSG